MTNQEILEKLLERKGEERIRGNDLDVVKLDYIYNTLLLMSDIDFEKELSKLVRYLERNSYSTDNYLDDTISKLKDLTRTTKSSETQPTNYRKNKRTKRISIIASICVSVVFMVMGIVLTHFVPIFKRESSTVYFVVEIIIGVITALLSGIGAGNTVSNVQNRKNGIVDTRSRKKTMTISFVLTLIAFIGAILTFVLAWYSVGLGKWTYMLFEIGFLVLLIMGFSGVISVRISVSMESERKVEEKHEN